MKRTLSFLLALALAVGLTACSGQADAGGQTGGADAASTAGSVSASEPETGPAPTERPQPIDPASVTVEPQVLAEWDGFTASVTGLEWDATQQHYRLGIAFENDTGSAMETFMIRPISINWDNSAFAVVWESSSSSFKTVPTGASEDALLFEHYVAMDLDGETALAIMRGEASGSAGLDKVKLETKPFTLKTSCYDQYPVAYKGDTPACDGSGVKVFEDDPYVITFDDGGAYYDAYFALENHNTEPVAVFALPCSVNGKAVPQIEPVAGAYWPPFSLTALGPGERSNVCIRLDGKYMEAWDNEQPVAEMEVALKVCVGTDELPSFDEASSFEQITAAGYELADLGTLSITFDEE